MSDNKLEFVGGAWITRTKNGMELINLKFYDNKNTGNGYTLWPNKYKQKETDPDFKVAVNTYQPKAQQSDGRIDIETPRPVRKQAPMDPKDGNDELPF